MDFELFAEKIKQLNDDKLKELLQLKNKQNASIVQLAEKEALRWNIDISAIERKAKRETGDKTKEDEGVNRMSLLAQFLQAIKD